MGKQVISAAPGNTGIKWEEWQGKLMVVEPLEMEHDVPTVHGEKDAVRANVYVLTGPNSAEEFEDTLIFPRALISQTKRQIGSFVVGRLTQGEAKKGQKPPWLFAEATDKDLKKASDFLARHQLSSASNSDDEEYEDEEDSF